MNTYNIIISSWGEQNGFDRFLSIAQEQDGEVFYVFHSSPTTGKNGLPQFIRVSPQGEINDSFGWRYEEINRYIHILKKLFIN